MSISPRAKCALHTVFVSIFTALLIIAVFMHMSMFVEFLEAFSQKEAAGESDQLGVGVTIAFAIVFMILFGGATVAISVPQIILSALLWARNVGGARIWGIVATLFGALSVVATVATFVTAVVMNNGLSA